MSKKIKYILGLIFVISILYNIKIYNFNYKDLFLKQYYIKYSVFFAIVIFALFLTSIRFLLILKKINIKINYFDSFKLSINQFYFNTLLFSGAGEIDKYFQRKIIKIRSDQMLASILMERLFGALSSVLLLLLSISFLLFLQKKLIIIIAILLLLMLFFFFRSYFFSFLLRIPYLSYFNNITLSFFKKKKLLFSIFILSLLIQLFSIIMYYYIFNFYFETSLVFLLIAVPIFNFISLLPITVAGIGVRDFFFGTIFFYFGTNYINVIPATLLIGLFILKTALLLFIIKNLLSYLKFFFLRKDVAKIDVKKIQ